MSLALAMPPTQQSQISAGVYLQHMTQRLKQGGCQTPRLDARLLLEYAYHNHFASDTPQDMPQRDCMLDAALLAECDSLVARRLAGEPVSRIRRWREFWSMEFALSPGCLDPRPDSETLVEAAIASLKKYTAQSQPVIIDYGTGCGCLLIAILADIKHAYGIGLDCAEDAIATATHNASRLGVGGRTRMLVSHWCHGLDSGTQAELIIANPPYIASGDMAGLPREVRLYDPSLALDGGVDGLRAMREILPRIKTRLKPNGLALIEIGTGQHPEVVGLAKQHGLAHQQQWCDLSGIVRVLGFAHAH